MYYLTSLNNNDRSEIINLIVEQEHVNFKKLNQRERACCLIAIKQNLGLLKIEDKIDSLDANFITNLKTHMSEKSEKVEQGGLFKNISRSIARFVKGLFNDFGLRISSAQLENLANSYRNRIMADAPQIENYRKDLQKLHESIHYVQNSAVPACKQTITILKTIRPMLSANFKEAKEHLNLKVNEYNEEIDRLSGINEDMVSALKDHLKGLEALNKIKDQKKLKFELETMIQHHEKILTGYDEAVRINSQSDIPKLTRKIEAIECWLKKTT